MVGARLGGWHRLWITASVLWAVWVLVQFMPLWRQLNPDPSWQSPSATASNDPDSQARREELRERLPFAGLRDLEREARRDLIMGATVRLVLPIAGAYGAGWALVWIRRGFFGPD